LLPAALLLQDPLPLPLELLRLNVTNSSSPRKKN
jgi:hypothetical protein